MCWRSQGLKRRPVMTPSHRNLTALPPARRLLCTSKWQKVMLGWRLPLRYWDMAPSSVSFIRDTPPLPASSPVSLLTCFISAAGSRSWSPVRFNHCLHMGFPAALGNKEYVDVRQIPSRTEKWLFDLGGLRHGRNWRGLKPKTHWCSKLGCYKQSTGI